MSHSQFHSIELFILRHAWLNLWDKRMLLAESTRLLSLNRHDRNTWEPETRTHRNFQNEKENHISWCHFIEEMESPVRDQLAKHSNHTQNLSCQALFYPRDHGEFMHQVNRKRLARPMLTVHELLPTATAVGEATLSSIGSMTHDLFHEQHPTSRRTEVQQESGSLLKWLLVSPSIQLLR